MIDKGLLIVISAPSGCGKSTVVRRLMERRENMRFSVSATTRSPREGEVDGVDYYFVDRAEFELMVREDRLLEHAVYVENCYGTPREPVERTLASGCDVLLDIDVQGAMQVREKCPGALLVFLMPPSFDELEKRLVLRGKDSMEVIAQRLETARVECGYAERFDHIIVNDDIERAVDEFAAIIDSRK